MSTSPVSHEPPRASRPPESLAERFWSLARGMESEGDAGDPVAAVRHVLAVLDKLDAGEVGDDVTVNTLSFLTLLRQQQLKGDLLYASPEQIRGEAMDERSLVFSVGVLLFEKLTGRHPFGAEGNPNRVARMRRGELASGVNFFPKVPGALRTVLVKAMGPFPEERFENLDQLRGVLEAYVDGHLDDGWSVARQPTKPKLPAVPAQDSVWPKELDEPKSKPFESRLEQPKRVAPVLWMLAGAALASAAFLLLGPKGSDGAVSEPAPAAEPAAERAAPAVTALPEPEPAAAAPTPQPEPAAAAPEPAPEPEPASTSFDPDLGAERALEAAQTCFTDARIAGGIDFGVSLLYSARDGLTHKVYYGNASALQPAERRCLSQSLVGISAGAAPDRNTIVIHSFWLGDGGSRVKARVKQ